jgi:serine/threonine-protein kinase
VSDPGARTLVLTDSAGAGGAAPPHGEDLLLSELRRSLAGEYEVEAELGRGGMAVVYRALEIGLQRPVALKVLPPGLGIGPGAARFKREARMAAALDHPCIIPIYHVGIAAGTFYIAMKLVEGRTLDAIIEAQGALPLPVILAVLRAATGALAFAHEHGTIHRDIKGANILVDWGGRVMVADFGMARATEEKSLTVSGSVLGTPHFMSPEQCAGGTVGPQGDQYSLGIVTFQMLTGSVPFDADSLMTILEHHRATPVPDVRAVRESVPEALVRVMETALAKDAAQRYASTADMLAAIEAIPFSDADRREADEMLRQLARGAPVAKVRTMSLPPLGDVRLVSTGGASGAPTMIASIATAPKWRSRLLWRFAVMLLFAGGVVGVAYWMLGHAPATTPSAQRAIATGPPAVTAGPGTAAPVTTRPADRVAPRPAQQALRPDAHAAAPAPEPTGLLRLRTLPPDAEVVVDDSLVGVGGLLDFEVRAGRRRLRISAPGYVTLDTLIAVDAGVTVRLGQVTLRRNEDGP